MPFTVHPVVRAGTLSTLDQATERIEYTHRLWTEERGASEIAGDPTRTVGSA